MNKCRFWLTVLIVGLLVVFSVGASGGAPELKVQKALGVTGASDVYNIPIGSTIIHLTDGSTKITGPDGKSVISAKSSEVGLIPTPEGMARADRVYDVPSGSFVHGASPNTIEIYDADGKLILTVIDQAGEADSEAVPTSPGTYPPTYDGTGWIEDAYYYYGPAGSYMDFYGQWTVPAAPVNSWIDDDIVYLFNGIYGPGANAWAGRTLILQPVVGHNEDWLVPGNPLNGRAWVVVSPSEYVRSAAIAVAVGNLIVGEITLVSTDPLLWLASIRNVNTGKVSILGTDLLGTTSQYLTMALESYNLEADNKDLFGTTDFVNMQVLDQNGRTIYPSWSGRIWPGATQYFTGLGVVIYDYSHVRLQTAR